MFRHATQAEVEQATAAGQPLQLLPLALAMESCFSEEEMHANFFATLDRGYTPINGYINKHSGACSVVGSGPSIRQTYKELTGDVIAINGALKFLLDHGVTPKYCMIWDCSPLCEQFAVPHPHVTYLIASRVHPNVFARLKGCEVVVWHAGGDLDIVQLLQRPDVIAKQPCEEPLIGGGTAGVTRSLYVAMTLGYKEIHIFGGDSCYAPDGQTHAQGSLVKEKDVVVTLGNDPPIYFRTTPEWCSQVMEYRAMYAVMACYAGVKLRAYGQGMLQTMHELLEAKRKHFGDEAFLKHIADQEIKREELDRDAMQQYETMKEPA